MGDVHPAKPVLASTLLSQERAREQPSTWTTGIKAVDASLPSYFFNGGSLIGISTALSSSPSAGPDFNVSSSFSSPPSIPSTQPYDLELTNPGAKLALRILTTHLLTSPSLPSHPPNTYIITPAPSTVFTPSTILHSLRLSHSPQVPLDTLKPLLSSISLLRYFDLPGLVDSISEISSSLPQHHHHHSPRNSLVLIDGLDTTLSALLHSHSSPLTANALLSSLLRQLHILVSTHPRTLFLLSTTASTLSLSNLTRGSAKHGPISAFAAAEVAGLTGLPSSGQAWTGGSTMTMMGTTAGVLEDAVDKWVLVHDPTGETDGRVVEVVKDDEAGEGVGLGCWAVWKG